MGQAAVTRAGAQRWAGGRRGPLHVGVVGLAGEGRRRGGPQRAGQRRGQAAGLERREGGRWAAGGPRDGGRFLLFLLEFLEGF